MSFNYSGNPAASVVDSVRFLVGDTDETEVQIQDEEISWLDLIWTSRNSVYWTASMAADAIAARYTREVSTSADSQSVDLSGLQQKYLDLAAHLRDLHRTLLSGGNVDAGGITAGEQPDQTIAPMAFGTGMHDIYEAGGQDFGDYRGAPYQPNWPESTGY